jgi:hypothetical protein
LLPQQPIVENVSLLERKKKLSVERIVDEKVEVGVVAGCCCVFKQGVNSLLSGESAFLKCGEW